MSEQSRITYYTNRDRLGELVMLHRLATEESETDATSSQASISSDINNLDLDGRTPSMSSVFGNSSEQPSSPTDSMGSGSRKPSMFHFRKGSSSSSDNEKRKKENHLVRWLRDGTVIYKSVGLGLMDLVIGTHLVQVANDKNIGTQIEGF